MIVVDIPSIGNVEPVGGTMLHNESDIPIIPGDSFRDPLSDKLVPIRGGILETSAVLPSSGGQQSLLDANMLACEARAQDAIRQFKDVIAGNHNDNHAFSR